MSDAANPDLDSDGQKDQKPAPTIRSAWTCTGEWSHTRLTFRWIAIGLAVGFTVATISMLMTEESVASRSRDIQRFRQLGQILDDVRAERKRPSPDFRFIHRKVAEIVPGIVAETKQYASKQQPAKQSLLRAAQDDLPKMMEGDLTVETVAERSFEIRLKEVQMHLGLR